MAAVKLNRFTFLKPVSALLLAVLPTSASADVWIPVAAGPTILSVLLLLPVIILEAGVIWWWLDLSFSSALGVSIASNLVSTLIGIPVAILAYHTSSSFVKAVVERLRIGQISSDDHLGDRAGAWWTWGDDEPLPKEKEWLGWATEVVVYLSVFLGFAATCFIELRVAGNILDTHPTDEVVDAIFFANILTYVILIGILFFGSVLSYRDYKHDSKSQS